MAGNGTSPCASCKLLRRRCSKDCIFYPYFPSDDPLKFAIVHKVFGASNVSKMLQELPDHQRSDAVSSLVYEANARVRDPVYGCVGAISYLQNQATELQMQLAVAQADILFMQKQQETLKMQLAVDEAEILCIQTQQEPTVRPTQQMDTCTDDEKSYDLHNSIPQCLSFSSSSSSNVVYDSRKKEGIFGYDMYGFLR